MFKYALLFALFFPLFFRPTVATGQIPLDEWQVDSRSSSVRMDDYAKQIAENRNKGYAVVLIPVSFETSYGKTFVTNWTNEDMPGSSMLVESKSAFRVGRDGQSYEVVFVNPGRFALRGTFASVGEQTWQNINAKPGVPSSNGLGWVVFQYGQTMALDKLRYVWQPAQYRDNWVNKSYCTAVFAGTGQCAASNNERVNEKVITQASGYRPEFTRKLAGKTDIFVATNKPVAEFEVRAGEIILIDSFFAEFPNYTFDETRCYSLEKDNDKWCELQELRLQHVPASIDALRKILSKPSNKKQLLVMPWEPLNPNKKLAQALDSIQYREVKINAKLSGIRDTKMGQTYVVGN